MSGDLNTTVAYADFIVELKKAKDRIEKLETANLKQSLIKVDDQMRIEKLEAALREIAQNKSGGVAGPDLHTCISIARKALEGKDD